VAQAHQASHPRLSTATHAGQYRFVDFASHVATKRRIEKINKFLLKCAGGGEEDEQRHCELKIFEEVGVGSSSRGKLRRREVEGRGDVGGRGGCASSDELDKLQTKQCKVQSRVCIENLVCLSAQLANSYGVVKLNKCLQFILRTEGLIIIKEIMRGALTVL
jgi:hypothetical protein